MKFKYKDQIVTASSKVEAIKKVVGAQVVDKNEMFLKARQGDTSILDYPIEYLMLIVKSGDTPIHWLVIKGKGIDRILKLPKKILLIKNKYGQSVVHRLAAIKVKEILGLDEELLKVRDNYLSTPVHYLAAEGIKEINNLPPSILSMRNKNGQTPLDVLRTGIRIK